MSDRNGFERSIRRMLQAGLAGGAVLCLTGIICCLGLMLGATNYYVAPNGNDSNAGTAAMPWRNIYFALTAVTDTNSVILVADGNYPGKQASAGLLIDANMMNGKNITVRAVNSGLPELIGPGDAYIDNEAGTPSGTLSFEGLRFTSAPTSYGYLYASAGTVNYAFTDCTFGVPNADANLATCERIGFHNRTGACTLTFMRCQWQLPPTDTTSAIVMRQGIADLTLADCNAAMGTGAVITVGATAAPTAGTYAVTRGHYDLRFGASSGRFVVIAEPGTVLTGIQVDGAVITADPNVSSSVLAMYGQPGLVDMRNCTITCYNLYGTSGPKNVNQGILRLYNNVVDSHGTSVINTGGGDANAAYPYTLVEVDHNLFSWGVGIAADPNFAHFHTKLGADFYEPNAAQRVARVSVTGNVWRKYGIDGKVDVNHALFVGFGTPGTVADNEAMFEPNLSSGYTFALKGDDLDVHHNVVAGKWPLNLSSARRARVRFNTARCTKAGGAACNLTTSAAVGGIYQNQAETVFENNIFDGGLGAYALWSAGPAADPNYLALSTDRHTRIDYNCYHAGTAGVVRLERGDPTDPNGIVTTLAGLQARWLQIGQTWAFANNDAHSLVADPLFIDAAGGNLAIQPWSPCIDEAGARNFQALGAYGIRCQRTWRP